MTGSSGRTLSGSRAEGVSLVAGDAGLFEGHSNDRLDSHPRVGIAIFTSNHILAECEFHSRMEIFEQQMAILNGMK